MCIISVGLLLGFNCRKSKDDVLTIVREDYNGSELRLDGFYYWETSNNEGPLFQKYALYKNGIIHDLGATKLLEDANFQQGKYKIEWGVFKISGTEIKFERWYPSSGGPLQAYIRAGQILNDTTFVIKESYRMYKGKKTEMGQENEIYHFKKFSPKPDSTNTYIK